ncbi:hypothetical protein KSP40_PGU021345 [Platanthera guangdongensis]|uniref:Uncharacterized protein n=1 Tax=Platanthera guangdongensis TaxID=2320717 RepID=A0ABR2MZ97_9ASPA
MLKSRREDERGRYEGKRTVNGVGQLNIAYIECADAGRSPAQKHYRCFNKLFLHLNSSVTAILPNCFVILNSFNPTASFPQLLLPPPPRKQTDPQHQRPSNEH